MRRSRAKRRAPPRLRAARPPLPVRRALRPLDAPLRFVCGLASGFSGGQRLTLGALAALDLGAKLCELALRLPFELRPPLLLDAQRKRRRSPARVCALDVVEGALAVLIAAGERAFHGHSVFHEFREAPRLGLRACARQRASEYAAGPRAAQHPARPVCRSFRSHAARRSSARWSRYCSRGAGGGAEPKFTDLRARVFSARAGPCRSLDRGSNRGSRATRARGAENPAADPPRVRPRAPCRHTPARRLRGPRASARPARR